MLKKNITKNQNFIGIPFLEKTPPSFKTYKISNVVDNKLYYYHNNIICNFFHERQNY